MDKRQAIAYAVYALKDSGVDDIELIKTVSRNMALAIDSYTEEYIENYYEELIEVK